MGKIPDACLILGAAVLWYILIFTNLYGPFDTYWDAYGVAFLLLGLGLVGKLVLGIAWLIGKVRA